jgi:collagenase-like PrtC family protease
MTAKLTLGPILFNWKAEIWRDFYFRAADEWAVDTVYVGEVICSKRSPFIEPYYGEVAERLMKAGKKVVFSTLSEIMIPRERKMTQSMCALDDFPIEANDAAALFHLRGKPHYVGQYVNTYNEDTMEYLVKNGAQHFTLPVELPATAIEVLVQQARRLQVACEVMVFGRAPLALSARCYHARAHNRMKDNCQFVCENDPDGMELKTADGKPFLAINGVQTMSHTYLSLLQEMPVMLDWGVDYFRLSPHTVDMGQVITAYQGVLDKRLEPLEAVATLLELDASAQFSNGFFHHQPGYLWHNAA